jgi:peptidoglycan/LPS O-acetylase OafA/YrhL
MGHLAVDFFFVLSGFVLAHAYTDRLKTDMGTVEFIARRYIRFAPFYFLGSLVGLAMVLSYNEPLKSTVITVFCALLFLPRPKSDPMVGAAFPLNSPAWSLCYELIINVVFALLARFLGWRLLGLVLAIGAAAVIADRVIVGDLMSGAATGEFPSALARVTWSFFAGVAVYRLWRAKPGPATPPWLLLALLVGMMALPVDIVWVLLGFPLLVYLGASTEPKGFMAPVFSQLGILSYGLYAIHKPIILMLDRVGLTVDAPWKILLVAVVLVPLVIVLDRWYDAPVRRWLEERLLPLLKAKRLVRRRAAVPASVPRSSIGSGE